MRGPGIFLLGCCCLPVHGEISCFRTAAEAALQAGVRDGEGFRLEGVRLDRVGGSRWARVVSCLHPERPVVAVKMARNVDETTGVSPSSTKTAQTSQALVRPAVEIGATVQVVQVEANVRLELGGVAQGSGGVGDAVRVRIGPVGEERFVEAVVRGSGVVELEARR